ncbi:MAG: hypothetical protein KU37_10020 [Sulfuricurvum sp. PC08-66]|nr:MAG: hypothetical protein KU37_10020 [Sulfuricurvum sp. PC08-66]
MDREHLLYQDDEHLCVMFSLDDEEHASHHLAVNQFLIVHKEHAVLIDPGSEVIFDELVERIEKHISIERIKFVFFSHQDPDVAGSIAQWSIACGAKFVMSGLWVRFMSHYGLMDLERIVPLPDKGAHIDIGAKRLYFLPAHFLHSPGNFSLFDAHSGILFSGDIGAAVMDMHARYIRIEDFEAHAKLLEAFHLRYMGPSALCRTWVEVVRKFKVKMIAPQHGALFEGENVEKFLTWFEALKPLSDTPRVLYGLA